MSEDKKMALPVRVAPPRVIMLRKAFHDLCDEANVAPVNTADPDWPGSVIIGFAGTASTLATFILAAHALLGPYDAQVLASAVRSRPALGMARGEVQANTREMLRVYYFPGMELL